ncbi:Uncharacterised protein [Vibrio cholerae]|nr:Uncharacterised protein [Vibrio cholerae]CSI45810.1 Uncharacterised protein [Vibrio cholerae]
MPLGIKWQTSLQNPPLSSHKAILESTLSVHNSSMAYLSMILRAIWFGARNMTQQRGRALAMSTYCRIFHVFYSRRHV